jgi:adenosine deaminase
VLPSLDEVPVLALRRAGLEIALGADDPLVFRSGLLDQYAPYSAVDAADLAGSSIRGSLAPPEGKARLLAGVDAWLRAPG